MELKTVQRITVIWVIILAAVLISGALLHSKVLIIVGAVLCLGNMVFQYFFFRCPYCNKAPFGVADRKSEYCQYCSKKVR